MIIYKKIFKNNNDDDIKNKRNAKRQINYELNQIYIY